MIRQNVALRLRAGAAAQIKAGLGCELATLKGHTDGVPDLRHFENLSVGTPLHRGSTMSCGSTFAGPRSGMPACTAPAQGGWRLGGWRTEGGVDSVAQADVAP
jgi:hypothetical protein